MQAGLLTVLESDYRQLAHDSRKVEGFAGFFASSDHHPEVKEAAERAVLKIRSLTDQPNALEQIKSSKELLKPLQLACETKSAKLITQALSIAQKLLSNDALSPSGAETVVSMMAQVEKIPDESVKLKILQLALTLLQSHLRPTTEDGIAAVLGICFRTFTQKGSGKDTVSSTAAATVRQAVALVFSYVNVEEELQRLAALQNEANDDNANNNTSSSPSVELAASQKLLEDLIAIALGAPPTWLKTPSLPRTFVIEVLDFAMINSAPLFRALPEFESTLSLRISQLLQSQMQDYLDAGAAGSALATSTFPTFKATLRCMRTLLRYYYPQLGGRCGALVQTVLRGLSSGQPLYQRIAVAQLMKQILGEPSLVYYLFSTYDMQRERKLDAVHALVRGSVDVIDYALKGGQDGNETLAATVAGLYQTKSAGKDWTLEQDYDTAPPATQLAYFTMLSIDSLLAFLGSVERLTSAAVESSNAALGNSTDPRGIRGQNIAGVAPPGLPSQPVEIAVCEELVDRTWRSSLAVLTQALTKWSGEELILNLLKGYQVFTQAAGLLQMEAPRDAYLASLCDFALASRSEGAGSDADSPRSSGSGNVPRRSPSFSGDEDLTGTVLSTKNVQAIRTLFNIAHRLSPILGSGWSLVLETLNSLDRILESPKTTTQEAAGNAAAGGSSSAADVSGDLAILSAAASQLFESSKDMQTEAVIALMAGLRDVSIKHLSQAAAAAVSGGPPRMLALNRMVEVLLINVTRVHDLWAVFLSHVLELVGDSRPAVRAAAIDALGRGIVGTLAGLNSAKRALTFTPTKGQSTSPPAGNNNNRDTATTTGGIEHMLLVALEALHNDERERDVRSGVLRVLLNVLQRHGERLTDGWTPVFRLLATVPEQGDPETTELGFQCMQLIASDYMSAMPFARLRRCLQVVVLYGQQGADLNVSLTTISMLWNASDMLGKTSSGGGVTSATSTDNLAASITDTPPQPAAVPSSEGGSRKLQSPSLLPQGNTPGTGGTTSGVGVHMNTSTFITTLAPEQVEEMQEMVFSALQSLAQDPRPEVRNSGVRTLFAVVVNQGTRLPQSLWEECLWEILFPLLRHAFHMSATSSKQEAEAALLGRSKGQQVRLVMHHSRNTEQKQWDETVVLALGGMSRLLRTHLPAIIELDGMDAGWEELMVVVESAIAGGRKEVALAAVSLLHVVLGAHGGSVTITEAMWKRALRATDVGVEAATTSGCMVPLTVRTEILALIGHLYENLRPRFDNEDTLQVFYWIEAFCRNPWSEDDATSLVQTVGMPPVQKAALVLLPSLIPDHAPNLWPQYLKSMIRLLQPTHVVEQWKEQQAEAALMAAAAAAMEQEALGGSQVQKKLSKSGSSSASHPMPKQAQSKYALNSAFLEKVLDVLAPVYESAPESVQAATFADFVESLGKCMEVRYSVYQEQLWRSAAKAFNRMVSAGLPAIAAASTSKDQSISADAARAWPALAEALELFLLGKTTKPHYLKKKTSKLDSSSTGTHQTSTATTQKPLPIVPIIDIPSSKPPHLGGSSRRTGSTKPGGGGTPTGTSSSTFFSQQDPPVDPERAREDADLEVSVLDTLSDTILTSCGTAPRGLQQRLVEIIDSGVGRSPHLAIPLAPSSSTATSAASSSGSSFDHVCLRKLYALCSRGGGGAPDVDGSRLGIAQRALPLLIFRADAILRSFCEEPRPGSSSTTESYHNNEQQKPPLPQVMCVLELLAGLTVAPEVSDAVLQPGEYLTQVVLALRERPEIKARGRERTHLLLLHSALCGCIVSKEVRVREMARDVLQLAGAELGLGGPLHGLKKNIDE